MPSYTIYGLTGEGYIDSSDATYATARTGGTLTTTVDPALLLVGQATGYQCLETFEVFDCSGIDAGETVTSAILNLSLFADESVTDFLIEARNSDWGATLTNADWVSGASLSGLTLLGSLNTSGIGPAHQYKQWSDVAMSAHVDSKAARTYVVLSSSRHRIGDTPTGDEYVILRGVAQAGTGSDPYLDVTTNPGPTYADINPSSMIVGF
jgi:hypothetical protein